MKRFKYLFVLLLAVLAIPFMVYADEEVTESNESSEVNLYFFRGEGCSHCAEAEEWFNSIEEEYGSMFKIVDYETWYNEDNANLMQKVAEARGEEANGVPYIIVGNKSWNGFTESYGTEIIEQIKSEYEKSSDDRYDIMELLSDGESVKKEESSNDVVALIIVLVVVGGICFGIYKARTNTN